MSSRAADLSLPAPIRRKLRALRRAVSLWFWVDGLAVLCLTMVGLAALSLLVDRTFRMDRMQRLLCLCGGAAGLVVLAWRRLVRPLTKALGDDALSLVVESRHAELGERLIAAIQFSRVADAAASGASPAMVQASIDSGVGAVAAVDFADALDRRTRNRNLLRGVVAVAVVGGAFALFPSTMRLWFERNVLLGSRTWPQKTHLRIVGATDGGMVCPRGDDLSVHVEADPEGVVPSLVTVRYRQSGGSGSEPMAMVGSNLFRVIFKNVLEPFRFRASGGDADTPWCAVRLVERPVVDALELAYTPPSYIGTARVPLPANIGPHPVPAGSTLAVEGRASKPLARAGLAFGKGKPGACEVADGRGFRTTVAGEGLRSGAYAIVLEDTDGYASKQPARFVLKVLPDRKPVVRAKLDGIGALVTPRATIPIRCRMTDDYAVVRAEIVYALHTEDGQDATPQRMPYGARDDLFGPKEVATVYRLEAEPMRLPVGSHLTFHVAAEDNDTVTGPKVGVSGTFSLRVVTEDELRAELLQREQEQRMEFERLLRDQIKLLEHTRTLLASLEGQAASALPDESRRLLATSEKRQRLVGGRCITIAEHFAAILAEVVNNKLEETEQPVRRRLQGKIIEPLQLLARRGVLQAADLLDIARKAAAEPPKQGTPGRAALAGAAAEQEKIVVSMREILRNMVKWEGYQEAVTLLREVLKAQKEVSDETRREYRRRIERIFDN